MHAYEVVIVAEMRNGTEARFTEVIAFPLQPLGPSGRVCEADREAGAIEQLAIKCPGLRNLRAISSGPIARFTQARVETPSLITATGQSFEDLVPA